jgi:hypothetical protein
MFSLYLIEYVTRIMSSTILREIARVLDPASNHDFWPLEPHISYHVIFNPICRSALSRGNAIAVEIVDVLTMLENGYLEDI